MIDIWSLINALIVAGIGGYLAYMLITEIAKQLIRKDKPRPVQKIIVHGRTYCGIKDRHVHYKVNTIIRHNNEEHLISYYYCPLTHRIHIIMPKPKTPDEVKYDYDYEEKANHMGE